jgi:uncharacterized repeat protein (TIGR01451 family)
MTTTTTSVRPVRNALSSAQIGFGKFWCVLALLLCSARLASGALSQQIVQQFYVPFPETDFQASLQGITSDNVGTQMQTILSIVVGTTNTVVVYDHWEDGYENDLNNPTQPNTQVWGDGILTNGVAPGYTNDLLPPGAVITLTNIVSLPRNPSTLRYDGRDRIGATRPVTLSRAGWSTTIGTLLASATEVYDTSRYGTAFTIPVGTNTTPAVENFSYSSLHIIAAQNGTVVTIDRNGDGVIAQTNTLNMGESVFVNGKVLAGARVLATKPVQVHELTGRVGSSYQSRTFAIRPVEQWDTSYYAPVGTTTANNSHNVFVFNQYATNLTVLYSTRTNSGSFSVPGKGNYKFPMPLNSGARFYTTNDATFYAVGCNDSGSSSKGNNQNFDWGYALLPAAALTPVVIVGWAPGSDDQSAPAGPDQNGSPVWVTPTKATTIYVNYTGDYSVGPQVAPNGHRYNTNYTLAAYQFQTIFNPATKNMTGARIFTADGTTFAAAWGEDASVSSQGAPYLDAGTGIIPFPVPNISKSSALAVDQDGNGKLSWGDTLEYTIRVQNDGMLVLGNVLVLDALPNSLKYVTNSTTVNGAPVADNLVPPAATAFPLDEAGLILPQIQVNGFSEIKYRVTVAPGATSISNSVIAAAGGTVGSGDDTVQSSESVVAAPPVIIDFTDASGNPVSAYVINSGIFVTLNDLARNTNSTSIQTVSVTVTNTANGDREILTLTETGTNTGVFRNTSALPSSVTSGAGATNGTLLALAGHALSVAYTDPVTANSDSATAGVAAAPLPSVSKTSQLVTDLNGDGRIGWGDTISYTIVLTNASAFTISNLVVLDSLPTNAAYINNTALSNNLPIADAGVTTFPLDESGFTVGTLPSGASISLSFQATVLGGTSISNTVTVSNAFGQVQAQNIAAVLPPPPTCNLSFADASGSPVFLVQENAGLYAALTDPSRDTDATTPQSVTVTVTNLSNGDVESLALTETGTNTGIFRGVSPLATATTSGGSPGDGTLNSHIGNQLSVQYAGPSGETCSATATVIPAIQTKKLYLNADASADAYQNLDRIDPVAAGKMFTSNSAVLASDSATTFVQTPAFCSDFFMPAGSLVKITNYFQVASGTMPANPVINASLKKGTNAATATTFLTFGNPAVNGGALNWSAPLPASVSVASGEMLFLEIASAQAGVTFSIQYNSAAKPSVVALPTTTVITLDQLGVYDAPFPAGNLITNATSGQTIYVRASASDPFGAYDVTAMRLAILNPGGFTATTNLSSPYVVSSNTCSKTFEYAWTAENWQGNYTIRATAFEGTEGITNSAQTTVQVAYPAGGTPSVIAFIDSTGAPTNSYATNQTVCVRVTDLNRNLNPGSVENVTAIITSTSGDTETMTLTETGTNTGVFSGCINANTSSANSGNGVLNAAGGSGLTVTYTDPFNPADTVTDTAIVRTPPGPKPTVSLFKTLVAPANGNVLLGNTVQFDITIGNPGSVTVTNVKVTDTFPASRLQFVSATLPPDSAAPAGTLTWNNLGPLASGQSVTISTYFTATAAGKLTNSVSVTGTTNVGPAVAIAANTAPAISVVKTLVSPNPGPAYINDTAIFRIAITNIGSTTVSSYVLQDQFSSACFQFLGASIAPSGSGGGLVLWTGLPSLAAGASTVIFVTNKVTGTCSPALNTAAISSAVDQSGTAIAPVQSVASVMNVGATASGTVWYDANVNATNDAGDTALSDVIVYADLNGDGIRQGNEPFATTDTNGVYQITSLPAGNYSARVDTNSLVDGLRPTFDVDGTNSPHRVSLTVTNGQAISGLNFGYVGSGSVGGYLWNDLDGGGTRESGEPFLPGVVVFIDYNANGARDASEPHAATDANGHYAFTNLVADTYRIAVDILSLPAGLRATYDADGTNTLHVASLVVAAYQNITNANFGYQGAASLSGVVTDAVTGVPIPGATVVVVDSLGGSQTVTSDGTGHFNVPSLWTGTATVTASRPGYSPATYSANIAPGPNTQNGALLANTLSGVIRDAATFLPLPGVNVLIVDASGATNVVVADLNGAYAVTNISIGTASVTAARTGYASASATPAIASGANIQDLVITANSLSGKVTDYFTGLPIAAASVSVVDSANVVYAASTDGAGNYTVSGLATGPATVTFAKGGYASGSAAPTIVTGANVQDAVLIPNILSGIIRDSVTTLPIAAAGVTVVDNSGLTTVVTTAADGSYSVTNIATGTATITASKSGYTSAVASPVILVGTNSQDLDLVPNSLGGQVTNALTGFAIEGVTVSVTDSSNAVHTASTDALGHYSIYNLPLGPATVTASKTGYASASTTLSIVPGNNIQDESLTPTTLQGEVTDRVSGQAISGASVLVVDASGTTNVVTTDVNGRYGVTNLVAGAATVLAGKDGFSTTNASPVIVVGANVQDLQIQAENPTLAVISSVSAYTSNQVTVIRWQTASEVGAVSYDVLRQTGSGWTKLNEDPIIAANSIAGASYDVVDTSASGAQPAQYKLVELEEQGTTRVYGPFTLRATSPLPSTAAEMKLASKSAVAKTTSTFATGAKALMAAQAPAAAFAKIATTNTGIQTVSAAAVAAALSEPVAAVQQRLLSGQFQLANFGRAISYLPNADGSAFSFYAVALKNNYTDKNVYLLQPGANPALPVANGPDASAAPAGGASYQATLALEQDILAVPTLVGDPAEDFWMWQRLVAGLAMFDMANISFVLDHVALTGAATNRLRLELLGGSEATHAIQVTLNGSVLAQDTWDGRVPHAVAVEVPSALLVSGTNRLSIKALKKTSGVTSQWYLNRVEVDYAREYAVRNGLLAFGANSNATIAITGFATPSVTLLDVSAPAAPQLVNNTLVAQATGGYSLNFAPANPGGSFVAFESGAGSPPASVTGANAASLANNKSGAQYLLITTGTFAPGATNLAAYRQQKGLSSLVVTVDDIYNEFGYGVASPDAIRNFLATALQRWPVKPRYVLFVGDGTYDYRDILQKHDNLVPPALVETAYGLFCSDTAYADVDGDGVPELAIGRLPVKTPDQLATVIAKIQAYEANAPLQNAQALLVSDIPDSAGDFTDAIQAVDATLSGTYSNALFKCATGDSTDTIRKSIQSNLAGGVDLFNYIGHGAIDRLGNSGYMTTADVAALNNTNRLPVVVAVTCVAGQFSQPGSDSIAENLALQPGGGAIAVIAPTGLSVNQDASRLNLRLMQLLRVNSGPALGDMFRQALADHVSIDVPDTAPAIYNLIGDPALAYNVSPKALPYAPQFTSVVNSNGVLVVTWTGGKAPYQLEKRGSADATGKWENIGTVTGNSAAIPMDDPMGLIRIRCDR